ncbi:MULTISPECIES: ABC transporter ATP-binding protein [unclassified Brucella]|uniref:ABC transporter ATP-binding protein n=1 Tax=unclassified Brucella TaxID=2632610 RepID=UPI0012AE4730|nr:MULTISPECIES: ABC transporter ATP-binding protein [unclassified Brucella]MRN42347.1 ATP-binding cassette domain-containing protein [Brucella sp. 09RB8913]MRN58669.1 ATP-binding cassette domain-containing protein [Brucella sp. 09RB8918]CAB4326274.1 O-antigen export system ATP-binding protein RfbE [Brucella sp. 191011898]
MYSDTVIEAENVSKVYLLYNKPEDRLKQMLVPKLKRLAAPVLGGVMPRIAADMPRYREFWALRDVSLNLHAHETLGIIGQNGSGKSTLLQIICGTLMPSSGVVQSEGRVAALLELGAGFNPDFTGRENVYLNAAIYGLTTAEIEQRMASIIEFAEIGEHIDQPVKTYSSGMFVRLAFSVIANVDADILIIDEALAVGDAYFQQKCMRFLRRFQERGSIFFVSHDTGAMMSFCDRVIWLHHGMIKAQGDPKEVCEEYLAYLYEQHTGIISELSTLPNENKIDIESSESSEFQLPKMKTPANGRGFGDKAAEIFACSLTDKDGCIVNAVYGGELVDLKIAFRAYNDLRSVISGFVVKDRLGQYIFGDNTFATMIEKPPFLRAGDTATARFRFLMPTLAPGTYSIAVAVASGTTKDHVQHHWLHEGLVFTAHTAIDTGVLISIPMLEIELTST